MVIYRTNFRTRLREPIDLGDILRDPDSGKEFIAVFDSDLGEAFEDLRLKTREMMTVELAEILETVERRGDGPLGD